MHAHPRSTWQCRSVDVCHFVCPSHRCRIDVVGLFTPGCTDVQVLRHQSSTTEQTVMRWLVVVHRQTTALSVTVCHTRSRCRLYGPSVLSAPDTRARASKPRLDPARLCNGCLVESNPRSCTQPEIEENGAFQESGPVQHQTALLIRASVCHYPMV